MVTLKDIAKEVGLNTSVVSRALNPKPDKHAVVAEETRQLIVETAERMGYQRNRAAEFLKKGRAATIGIFLPKVPDRLIADLMIGISEKAALLGFPINFFFGTGLDDYKRFFNGLSDASHSGLITYPFIDEIAEQIRGLLDNYQKRGGQIIVLNSSRSFEHIPGLGIDDFVGGQLAARQLLEHDCMAYLVSKLYDERVQGFTSVLDDRGQTCRVFENDELAAILRQLKPQLADKPIGIFATTDRDALSYYPIVRQMGLAVGETVKIVGYDNLGLSDMVNPALTTIHQPFRELGDLAVQKLVNMIYGKREISELIQPGLVQRQSA